MIKYGTAGFRDNSIKILDISKNIGIACAHLSHLQNDKIGICITASHNIYTDNGVKIMDSCGEYISSSDELLVTDIVNNNLSYLNEETFGFFIACDTRKTSKEIVIRIIEGILSVDKHANINNFGILTTPELHYYIANNENYISFYKNMYEELCKKIINCTVDCANGVGYLTLKKFGLKNIEFINTDVNNYKSLNNNCGSDYIITTQNLKEDKFMAYFDGDADRIVFSYKNIILDGDYISALIATFLKTINCDYEIAVIHTSYSSSSFVKYIKNLGIKTVNVATGVKNLHHEAKKYEIGIYFEANGHGTVLAKDYVLNTYPFLKLFNQIVGDSICNLLGILIILENGEINLEKWINLFKKIPYKLYAIDGFSREKFILDKNETYLINPVGLKKEIDKLDGYIFIRPSGTENKLRIYIESDKNIDELYTQVINILNNFSIR